MIHVKEKSGQCICNGLLIIIGASTCEVSMVYVGTASHLRECTCDVTSWCVQCTLICSKFRREVLLCQEDYPGRFLAIVSHDN